MVPPEAQYPDVYIDTFIFILRSMCKIIWMNVHYFPNAPRTSSNRFSSASLYIINPLPDFLYKEAHQEMMKV